MCLTCSCEFFQKYQLENHKMYMTQTRNLDVCTQDAVTPTKARVSITVITGHTVGNMQILNAKTATKHLQKKRTWTSTWYSTLKS